MYACVCLTEDPQQIKLGTSTESSIRKVSLSKLSMRILKPNKSRRNVGAVWCEEAKVINYIIVMD